MTRVRDESPSEVKALKLDLTSLPRSRICENEEGKPGWKKFLLTRRISLLGLFPWQIVTSVHLAVPFYQSLLSPAHPKLLPLIFDLHPRSGHG